MPSHPPIRVTAATDLDLLLSCAQPALNAAQAARIRELATNRGEWDAPLASAAEHGLLPIVCRKLKDHAGAVLPEPLRRRIDAELLRHSCHNLALAAELFRVLEALESDGICATPYKGPALAMQAYGDVTMRQFSDLDFLVPQNEIAVACGVLRGLRFRPCIPNIENAHTDQQIPGQYAYRNDSDILAELHTERTLRYFPRPLNLRELCARRELVKIAGRRAATFSVEDTLLLLCVHGSKHFWERLGWIADIAALSKGPRSIDWRVVLQRAKDWGVQRMLFLGTGLAAHLFDASLPGDLIERIERDRVARGLIARVYQRFENMQQEQLGVFSRFAFRVRMRGSLAQGLPYAMRLTFTPTELDWPHGAGKLRQFSAFMRPLRLARTYGWRTRAGS